MIASHQGSHEFILIGSVHQCFDELLGWELEKFRHFRNAFFAGRRNLLKLGWALVEIAARRPARFNFSLLHVRRIFAFIAAHDGIFAGFSQHLEFMGLTPANGAGVRFHRAKLQPAAGEDSFIGLEHVLVFTSAVLHIDVKTVGILHDELATPHQTKTGPDFIAEFRLNLIQIEG
jgi:hypothetical protein